MGSSKAQKRRTVLLRPKEVEQEYGVSRYTLMKWVEAGFLSDIRTPGGHHRFIKAELDLIFFKMEKK